MSVARGWLFLYLFGGDVLGGVFWVVNRWNSGNGSWNPWCFMIRFHITGKDSKWTWGRQNGSISPSPCSGPCQIGEGSYLKSTRGYSWECGGEKCLAAADCEEFLGSCNKGPSSQTMTLVFPVVMYGCENWTINKAEHWRIDAFELWCWRRLLRVPWTVRTSNQSILKEIILNIHWKDWCWNWSSNILATWC